MTKRATIADIAQRAGLSKGAVSYALNGLTLFPFTKTDEKEKQWYGDDPDRDEVRS